MVDMRFFQWEHLKPEHQEPTLKICTVARWINENIPDSLEKSTALRKLLEAKETAVRALIYPPLIENEKNYIIKIKELTPFLVIFSKSSLISRRFS